MALHDRMVFLLVCQSSSLSERYLWYHASSHGLMDCSIFDLCSLSDSTAIEVSPKNKLSPLRGVRENLSSKLASDLDNIARQLDHESESYIISYEFMFNQIVTYC